jgi:predicted Zn-dependent protease with MMP-like domain
MALDDRCVELYERGDFEGALACFRRLDQRRGRRAPPEERAGWLFDIGCCLDRLGRREEAEDAFARAEDSAPDDFPRPLRLDREEFDRLVDRALKSIPARFRRYLDQVAVQVRDYPGPEAPDPFVLGLYLGLPRTERSADDRDHLDTVLIYKRSHELDCLDLDELTEEVRKTVVHEIGHHFGLGEEDMGEYA